MKHFEMIGVTSTPQGELILKLKCGEMPRGETTIDSFTWFENNEEMTETQLIEKYGRETWSIISEQAFYNLKTKE